jgi:2,3-bisphosphoglycerate-dependent phosphoglycerate mutase
MAVITELILARHGEAHCNLAGLAGGEKTCTGLTARGRQQVAGRPKATRTGRTRQARRRGTSTLPVPQHAWPA